MRWRRALTIILLSGGLLALAVASAVAGSPNSSASATYRCKGTTAGGQSWAITQSNTNCAFARFAVQTAINKRRSPKNWRCRIATSREFSPEAVPYRVRCQRGEKRVLGLAR